MIVNAISGPIQKKKVRKKWVYSAILSLVNNARFANSDMTLFWVGYQKILLM